MRGPIDAIAYKATPGTSDIRSGKLQAMIDNAARDNAPVFLPPGNYRCLEPHIAGQYPHHWHPRRFAARLWRRRPSDERRQGRAHRAFRPCSRRRQPLACRLCRRACCNLPASTKCSSTIAKSPAAANMRCNWSAAAGGSSAAEYQAPRKPAFILSSRPDLTITGNTVEDCGNGGILIHRWKKGEDGSIVTGNRITRIGANDGGTGQNGNGINIFRAGGVMVSGNQIADCAFTGVRANSASNVQIIWQSMPALRRNGDLLRIRIRRRRGQQQSHRRRGEWHLRSPISTRAAGSPALPAISSATCR